MFLDQLDDALRLAQESGVVAHQQLQATARRHGRDLLGMGRTVEQVVHDYGDLCQVITELAVEQTAPVSADEFKTLNLCLDDAIAAAVTEYAQGRETAIEDQGTERLGVLAHELRNLLNTALLSFEMIRSGKVAAGGSTATLHLRSLLGLRDLIDRSLAGVRLDAGIERLETIPAADVIEEVAIGARIQAQARDIQLSVTTGDRAVAVEGDRPILAAALSNLLQNAFKFTPERGHVSLRMSVTVDRVRFEIEDECGGLPPGGAETLFRAFEQRGTDRSGVGLGLLICRKAAEANGGEIYARDLPGRGCVFTLDLPRKRPPV